ncbi:MAG: hypothetical protein WBC69_11755, partial [Geitlerinemataceae cyanobacterium]
PNSRSIWYPWRLNSGKSLIKIVSAIDLCSLGYPTDIEIDRRTPTPEKIQDCDRSHGTFRSGIAPYRTACPI